MGYKTEHVEFFSSQGRKLKKFTFMTLCLVHLIAMKSVEMTLCSIRVLRIRNPFVVHK